MPQNSLRDHSTPILICARRKMCIENPHTQTAFVCVISVGDRVCATNVAPTFEGRARSCTSYIEMFDQIMSP